MERFSRRFDIIFIKVKWMIDKMSLKYELDKPIFSISLDIESLWGYIANPTSIAVHLMKNDAKKGRSCMNTLLDLFENHDIKATCAVVGHLFLDRCEKNNIPHKDMPRFKDDWYSVDPCTNIKKDPLYYGKDIIEKIISNRIEHEIGCHSFSHVIFSECNKEVADAEIKMCIKLAKEFGITLRSFTFPQNKIGHIDILKKNGFKIYRGKNLARCQSDQNIVSKIFNGGIDRIVAPPVEPKWIDGIWEVPSSMFFYDHKIKFTLLSKAKIGLCRAVKSKKVFNIYLHPHDLLFYPSLRRDLDKFLGIISKKRDDGEIDVLTLGELEYLLNRKVI